jgi:DNA-binding transcriptional ArsR family regulator
MEIAALTDKAGQATRLLKSLANDRRLLILCHLSENEKSVGELERLVDLSQSALSQHLARLRRDNLVQTRREAQTIYYSIASPEADAVLQTLYMRSCRPCTTFIVRMTIPPHGRPPVRAVAAHLALEPATFCKGPP